MADRYDWLVAAWLVPAGPETTLAATVIAARVHPTNFAMASVLEITPVSIGILESGEDPISRCAYAIRSILSHGLGTASGSGHVIATRTCLGMLVDIRISDSGVMASTRTYDVLAAYLVASALGDAVPLPFVKRVLDAIDFPPRYRWIFAPIKAAAAIGLLSTRWSPGLARLTTAMLTLYFGLAVGFHVKARDFSVAALGAAGNAALFAALTLKEPAAAELQAGHS